MTYFIGHFNLVHQGSMPFQNMLLTVWMKQHALLCTRNTFPKGSFQPSKLIVKLMIQWKQEKPPYNEKYYKVPIQHIK